MFLKKSAKTLHHGYCFYLLSSLESERVGDSNDTGNYNGTGVCDQANKCFPFGSAHEPQTWETVAEYEFGIKDPQSASQRRCFAVR